MEILDLLLSWEAASALDGLSPAGRWPAVLGPNGWSHYSSILATIFPPPT